MTIAAKLESICKDFQSGDQTMRVLSDISVTINYGALTMLVGPSGCGKTTLISIISGILSATSGDILLLDQQLSTLSDQDKVLIRRRKIGFIFQQYNLLPALTAAENAALPLIADGMPLDVAAEKARTILTEIGMGNHADKYPNQLSGGQQQRVAIARALVHDPQLIVCDEPTAALDAKTGHGIMEILRAIANDDKRAVLVVTHDNRIYNFADRILEMSDGRLIGDHRGQDYIHKE